MLSLSPKVRKLIILFALYIAQATPMTLFATLLPILLRQQSYSLALIQLVQLIKLPWILKVFWAPMVDNRAQALPMVRRWIVCSELVSSGLILLLYFLEPSSQSSSLSYPLLLCLLFISIASSAIQDIAVDKYSILILRAHERSLGSGVQSAGAFVGSLIGSGILLLLYGRYGWETVVLSLSALVALALVPLLLLRGEADIEVSPSRQRGREVISLRDITNYVQALPRGRLLLLLISYASVVGLMGIVKLYLVDLGYETEEIALRLGIVGSIAAAVSSLLCSVLIRRLGVGLGLRLLYGCGIALTLLLIYNHLYDLSALYIWAAICMLWAIYGGIMVGLYTLSMQSVRVGREGTDFTLQTTLAQLGALVLSASSGLVVDTLGYIAFFLLEAMLCLVAMHLCRDLDSSMKIIA